MRLLLDGARHFDKIDITTYPTLALVYTHKFHFIDKTKIDSSIVSLAGNKLEYFSYTLYPTLNNTYIGKYTITPNNEIMFVFDVLNVDSDCAAKKKITGYLFETEDTLTTVDIVNPLYTLEAIDMKTGMISYCVKDRSYTDIGAIIKTLNTSGCTDETQLEYHLKLMRTLISN